MKILFVGRSVYHFTYFESILKSLWENGHNVKILFDRKWSKEQPDDALKRFVEETNIFCGWSLRRKDKWRKYIFNCRELLSFSSYISRKEQSDFYLKRWQNYLSPNIREKSKKAYIRWILGRRVSQRILKMIERMIPPAGNIVEFLDKKRPDIVIASPVNMRFSEEIEYIKAAKKLGIPTVIPVLSWDNLSTKGMIHVCSTAVFGWNKAHFNEAVNIHGISEDQVFIIGSPFFDKWFSQSRKSCERDEFCRKIGINNQYPFITYLGSSRNIARNEVPLLMDVITSLRKSDNPLLKNMGVLVRPHPANSEIYETINEDGVTIWPKKGYLPDSPDSIGDFYCSLKYSLTTIGINTSGMIDSIIVGTPCIAMMTEEYSNTQIQTTHFSHMIKSGCLYNVHDTNMLHDLLIDLSAGKDHKAVQRQEFVNSFIRPYGEKVSAGSVAAKIIESIGMGQQLQEIHAYLSRMRNYASVYQSPSKKNMELPAFIQSAREEISYKNYLSVRDRVMAWLQEASKNNYSMSKYWQEEVDGFDYMLDASPLIIRKLREHSYHITGLKSYEYRGHHCHAKGGFEWKLKELTKIDGGKYFVPESPEMGGFGHILDGFLVNIDTLKFYEALLALEISGILPEVVSKRKKRIVLEIGGGWGGFAYQFKTIVPDTCYMIIDLPQTMLFSATYLMTLFPEAKFLFYGDENFSEDIKKPEKYDFIFLPHYCLSVLDSIYLDLVINMISFQEMTSEQVRSYIERAYASGCQRIYSFNRERSKHNTELTTVSSIIERYYDLEKVDVLDIPYTALSRPKSKVPMEKTSVYEYRHLVGTRRKCIEGTNLDG